MPGLNTERRIHIRMGEDACKRLRIRCAELDTTTRDYVVELLDRALPDAGPRSSARSRVSPGRR